MAAALINISLFYVFLLSNRTAGNASDEALDRLPTSATCMNLLKLPPYRRYTYVLTIKSQRFLMWSLNDLKYNVFVQQRANGAEVIVCNKFRCWFWLELIVAKYIPLQTIAFPVFQNKHHYSSTRWVWSSWPVSSCPIKDCSEAMNNTTRPFRRSNLQVGWLLADVVHHYRDHVEIKITTSAVHIWCGTSAVYINYPVVKYVQVLRKWGLVWWLLAV